MTETYEEYFKRQNEEWKKVMIERGHTPIMCDYDETSLDIFVCSEGYCNGPGCSTCGWSTCMHCDRTPNSIPVCSTKEVK